MKLSNNALNFLLAQYRAIFKRAYVKGLASAVILTAGLATGQAQAALGDQILGTDDFKSAITDVADTPNIIKTSNPDFDLADLDASSISGQWTFLGPTTIDGATINIQGSGGVSIGVAHTLTVQNGGKLTFSNDRNSYSMLYGNGTGIQGTLTVTGSGSELNSNSAFVEFNKVDVKDGATIRIGGMMSALKDDNQNQDKATWYTYANVYADAYSDGAGGEATVQDATVNLDAKSIFGADNKVLVEGNSIINFNGDWEAVEDADGNAGTGYASAIIRANRDQATSIVTIQSTKENNVTKTPTVNVLEGKHGAIFAHNINISGAKVNLGAGSSLTLDGDWAGTNSADKKTVANEDKHTATKLALNDVTFDNQGTVIIGNALNGGSGTVTGTVKLPGDVKNFATVTISGTNAADGKAHLIISEDQILKQTDKEGKAIAAGMFAGSNSGIVLSGATLDSAILELKGTDSNGLDLNKDVTFASQNDVTNSKTAGKILVQSSGTLAGEHFVLKEALSLPTAGKLALDADVLEIGKADGTLHELGQFGVEAFKTSDRVVLDASGDGLFSINKGLTLDRDYYVQDADGNNTTTPNTVGTIEGDDLRITGSELADGHIDVVGGAWRNEGQTLDIYYGTLNVKAGAATDSEHVNDGADATGWDYATNGNPASLTWTGNFKLNGVSNSAESALINVTGASGADATLDLTGANITWGAGTITLSGDVDTDGDPASHTSATDYFKLAGNGILTITGNQFSNYLDSDDGSITATKMILEDGGLLLVKGAVTDPINFNKFTDSTGSAAAGNVHFSGMGRVLSTGELSLETGVDLNDDDTLTDGTEQKALTLGEGAIGAVGIRINNRNPELDATDADLADDYVEVSGGTLAVASSLSSSNNEIRFTGANLVLDGAGFLADYGVSNTGTGVVAVNKLTFSGSNAELSVETGSWSLGTGGNAGDIDLRDGAKISVGAGEAEFARNGISGSLSADNVGFTGADGALSINEGGSATFNTMQVSDSTNININGGSLTLTGNVTDSDLTAENVPETLADLGSTLDEVKAVAGINLSGATIKVDDNGELVLGDTAATALVKFSTTENADTGYVDISENLTGATITLDHGSVLKLDFSESSAAAINGGEGLTKEQARELKDELVQSLEQGSYIHVGQLGLDIIYDDTDMTAQWSDLKDFVHVVSGQVGNNVTERLLVQGITSSDNDISGQFGALEAATVGQNSIRVDGTLGLHEARDNFFASQVGADGKRTEVGLTLNSYSDVSLYGLGTVGTLQGSSTGDDTLVIFKEGTYAPGVTTIKATGTTNDAIVNIGRVEVDNDVIAQGDVKVGSLKVSKSLSAENVSLDGGDNGSSAVFGTLNVAKKLTVGTTSQANALYVANGNVTADELALVNGSTLYVGWDAQDADVNGTDIDESQSYSGQFYASKVDLGNGGIVVDPAVGDTTAVAAFNQFQDGTKSETSFDLGSANGNLFVGQNSALGLGFTSLGELQEYIAQHQTNGALTEYQAIAALNGTLDLTSGHGLTMTQESLADFVTYMQDKGWAVDTKYGTVADSVYFGQNTALKVTADAMNAAAGAGSAVVTLAGNNGTLINDGGKILISGEVRAQQYKLFTDADGKVAVVDINKAAIADGAGIEVSTENGFLVGEINNTNGGLVDLTVNHDRGLMSGASNPVYDSLVAYAQGYKVVGTDDQGNPIREDLYDGYIPNSDDGNGNPVKDTAYSNYFLNQVISTGNGADAETAARLGIYAGAPQAAMQAGKSSTDAIAQRFGIGSAISNLTLAGNTQGAALWLAPVYKSADSDGFEAQGLDYGVNVDLYGVALGADYTLANGITFGAMFNVGSGEVDGEGAASATSNDFDYYGFGLYAGYTMGQFSVVGDVSYTTVDNDLEGNTSVDRIGASMDSTNLSIGVTGKYELSFDGVDITPHAGLRFSNIDLDDYTIDGNDVIASADSDDMSIFSIPVGVTVAKEFKGETWTVAPSLDLTVTGQFGDDELDGEVSWAGVSNLSTHTTTEVFDNFTYGATLGVEAQSVGGVALGISVGYTGSSNTDELGVNANARFVF